MVGISKIKLYDSLKTKIMVQCLLKSNMSVPFYSRKLHCRFFDKLYANLNLSVTKISHNLQVLNISPYSRERERSLIQNPSYINT